MKKIPTTATVFNAIREAHPELVPFGGYTHTHGSPQNPSLSMVATSYGFPGFCDPIVMVETQWDYNHQDPHSRENLQNFYWLTFRED